MRPETGNAMQVVRGEMCVLLDRLEATLRRRGAYGVRGEVAAIATLAAEYGLLPALRITEGLGVALDAGGRGAAVQPWIERLRDAIDCEAVDPLAADAWLASILVRLAG